MNPTFRLKYKETEKQMTDTFKLFLLYKNYNSYKSYVAFLGVFIYIFIMYIMKPRINLGLLYFTLQFLSFWLAAFVVGDIYAKTSGRKKALKDAEMYGYDQYHRRLENRREELEIEVEFFDDKFTFTVKENVTDYNYNDVSRILETKDVYGIMIGHKLTNNQILAIPKSSMKKEKREKFIDFLMEKTTNRKKKNIINVPYDRV